jgi:hypothetical protein
VPSFVLLAWFKPLAVVLSINIVGHANGVVFLIKPIINQVFGVITFPTNNPIQCGLAMMFAELTKNLLSHFILLISFVRTSLVINGLDFSTHHICVRKRGSMKTRNQNNGILADDVYLKAMDNQRLPGLPNTIGSLYIDP